MSVKLLTEHHLEFLSSKGSCTGSSESTHVKIPHCWKSHVAAHFCFPLSAHLIPVIFIIVKRANLNTIKHINYINMDLEILTLIILETVTISSFTDYESTGVY